MIVVMVVVVEVARIFRVMVHKYLVNIFLLMDEIMSHSYGGGGSVGDTDGGDA